MKFAIESIWYYPPHLRQVATNHLGAMCSRAWRSQWPG